MTPEEIEVNALLATTCSRLLNAAALVDRMRNLHRDGQMADYWRVATAAGEHLTVAGHAITEAHTRLLAASGIVVQQPGGMIN